MDATLAIREAMVALLAADAATLAPAADANKIALVMNEINPGEALTFADCTLATFTGATPIAAGTGTQPSGTDSFSGASVISIKVPAGGFRWETTDAVNLPQTIYGFILVDNAVAVLLAAARFDTPITLTAAGQVIENLDATIQLAAGTLT